MSQKLLLDALVELLPWWCNRLRSKPAWPTWCAAMADFELIADVTSTSAFWARAMRVASFSSAVRYEPASMTSCSSPVGVCGERLLGPGVSMQCEQDSSAAPISCSLLPRRGEHDSEERFI